MLAFLRVIICSAKSAKQISTAHVSNMLIIHPAPRQKVFLHHFQPAVTIRTSRPFAQAKSAKFFQLGDARKLARDCAA